MTSNSMAYAMSSSTDYTTGYTMTNSNRGYTMTNSNRGYTMGRTTSSNLSLPKSLRSIRYRNNRYYHSYSVPLLRSRKCKRFGRY